MLVAAGTGVGISVSMSTASISQTREEIEKTPVVRGESRALRALFDCADLTQIIISVTLVTTVFLAAMSVYALPFVIGFCIILGPDLCIPITI